jgi:D-alanyl-D-alanine carboxypeptidase
VVGRGRSPRVVAAFVVAIGLVAGAGVALASHAGRGAPDEPATAFAAPTSGAPVPVGSSFAPPSSPAVPTAAPTTPEPPAATPTATGIDLAAHSTTDPASIWVIVNKRHPIDPIDWAPDDLVTVDGAQIRAVVQPDLEAMLAAAQADGVSIGLRTGYRSYSSQASIRADVERRRGFAHAERYSARAGYSEHQTGLSFDLHSTSKPSCDLQTCFADTAEGQWVAAHAVEYGFVVRYTPENTAVTGYSPEAWHLRYVGRELADWMAAQGIDSLEEALGVTGGPDYAD